MIFGRRVKDDTPEPFKRIPVDADGEEVDLSGFEDDPAAEEAYRDCLRQSVEVHPRAYSPPGPSGALGFLQMDVRNRKED